MVTKAAFYWNGAAADGGGNFTLQPGISPSTAVLRFPLSTPISQIGTLTLTNGTQTINFSRCRVVRIVINESGGGGRWREVTIEDRRWMWADSYFSVFGEYNRISTQRSAGGNYRSSYQLSLILLNALGEANFTVAGVPTNQYPPISWDAANPASELDQILQANGCILSLVPGDVVRISRFGVGQQFNGNDRRLMDFQATYQPMIIPGNLVFDGGAIHIHHDLPLRAVGPNTTSLLTWSPIDSLSYAPTAGWSSTNGRFVNGAGPSNVKNGAASLADKYIYKTYEVCEGFTRAPNQIPATKIRLPIPPGIKVSSGGVLNAEDNLQQYLTVDNGSIHRILPLNETRYKFGDLKERRVLVYGFRFDRNRQRNTTPTPVGINAVPTNYQQCQDLLPAMADSSVMPIADPPPQNSELVIPDSLIDNIDFNEGRVFFNEQVFLKNDATIPPFLPTEAWLRLRCSFPIRDPVTMAMVTAQYWYNPSNPAEVQVTKAIKNSEVFLEYINDTVATSNLLSFLSAAQSQLAAEIGQYSSGVGVSAPYQTWVFDIPPDGIVRAVAWDHTEAGEATTHIDYNYERPSYYDTLNERRLKRLFTYNSVLNLELARKQKRGVTQVRFGGNKP